jgi:2,4-dienoyl-CoA reductase-like NADH-dependent reductase (Old Yellow Enzyme family)
MAEAMASTHMPDDKFVNCYGKWAEGGWGMVLTGLPLP